MTQTLAVMATGLALTFVACSRVPATPESKTLTAEFHDAAGHRADGRVEITIALGGTTITLLDDFSIDEAPDPRIGFGNDGTYDTTTTFTQINAINGKQTYQVPSHIDASNYNQIYIWCEKYSVPIGIAAY